MHLLGKNWFYFNGKPKTGSLGITALVAGLFILVLIYFIWMGGRIISGVRISGLEVGGMRRQEVQRILMKQFEPQLQKKVTLRYNNRSFAIVLGTIGLTPNYSDSVEAAYRVGRTGNLFTRFHRRLTVHHRGMNVPLKFKHNRNTLDSFYRLVEAGIAVEPIRTIVTVDSEGNVGYSLSREGKSIDRDRLTYLLEQAYIKKTLVEIDIPVKIIQPSLTESDVERWKLNKVLGMFSTRFNPDLSDRVHNLRIASQAINNVIVYPGQNFSFNTWVGPRLAENGYKEAPVVVAGELVPGIGGGVCQVSSTLYNAVLLSNLRVVKRYNHTLPSAYVAMGRDATVVDNGMDFMFENNLNTPVLLVTAVESPYLRVAILGEKTNWRKVELQTELLKVLPFKTIETFDPTLKPEERIKEQEGRQGYRVALWRIVHYKDGTKRKYLESTSIYPARPEKYKVGIMPDKERL